MNYLRNRTILLMKNCLQIYYQLATDPNKSVQIPMRYRMIVDDADLCTKTVYCDVDLPHEKIPSWLKPATFEMVNHYRSGIHVIHYNDGKVRNMDAEFFRYKLFAEIMLKERLKEGIHMENC